MKTIIIYGSKYGNTEECVKILAEQLDGEVCFVNICNEQIQNVDYFDNIIIGGSIYMGQIQKKIKLFCSENKEILLTKRLALFLCCGLPENFMQSVKMAFQEELLTKSVATECFGGELRTTKMNFADKMITSLMKKATANEGKSEPMQIPGNIKKLAEIINMQ